MAAKDEKVARHHEPGQQRAARTTTKESSKGAVNAGRLGRIA